MQITLLPALLSSDSVVSVPAVHQAFTPGGRLLATVLGAGLEGGTLLSLGGREVLTGSSLPYPPGTSLHLEVIEGGRQPSLRVVSTAVAVTGPESGAAPAHAEGPPVSAVTYGMAAAVLAARGGADLRSAASAFANWVPALVSSGVLTAAQADALLERLAPVRVPAASSATPDGARAMEAAARAIAERIGEGGLLLERRLADVVRGAGPGARLAADLRSRLALVAHLLEQTAPGLTGARDAVSRFQEALLAEQARTAAHLASGAVVDLRLPLQGPQHDTEMGVRMRIKRDADDAAGEEATSPWRQVQLDLEIDGLGRIQVRLGVIASQVRAEFFVEHAGAADQIEAGLADLGASLEGAGFARVLSRVVVDPVRACEPDQLPDLPVQHSILDTRA
jgi:hypothetical protein